MGLFSWTCAKSGESVASTFAGKPKEQSQCYLVTPGATYYEDKYEGYGVFGGHDVYDILGDGDRGEGIIRQFSDRAPFEIKVVLAKHYAGETYEELEASEDCEFQGYFYEDDDEEEEEEY